VARLAPLEMSDRFLEGGDASRVAHCDERSQDPCQGSRC
jgi:hypothetical protein